MNWELITDHWPCVQAADPPKASYWARMFSVSYRAVPSFAMPAATQVLSMADQRKRSYCAVPRLESASVVQYAFVRSAFASARSCDSVPE